MQLKPPQEAGATADFSPARGNVGGNVTANFSAPPRHGYSCANFSSVFIAQSLQSWGNLLSSSDASNLLRSFSGWSAQNHKRYSRQSPHGHTDKDALRSDRGNAGASENYIAPEEEGTWK